MTQVELSAAAQQWANDILVWVGFGTLVGLLAKAVMPGRDPGGAIATLVMGIVGSVIGCGTLTFFYQGLRVTPLSALGFLVAVAGALMLLVINRLFGGRLFREEVRYPTARPVRRRSSTRRYADATIDESL